MAADSTKTYDRDIRLAYRLEWIPSSSLNPIGKLNSISKAALDVFENEPNPEIQLLMNPDISLTPHIGAATGEAQDRIGAELADQIIDILA